MGVLNALDAIYSGITNGNLSILEAQEKNRPQKRALVISGVVILLTICFKARIILWGAYSIFISKPGARADSWESTLVGNRCTLKIAAVPENEQADPTRLAYAPRPHRSYSRRTILNHSPSSTPSGGSGGRKILKRDIENGAGCSGEEEMGVERRRCHLYIQRFYWRKGSAGILRAS